MIPSIAPEFLEAVTGAMLVMLFINMFFFARYIVLRWGSPYESIAPALAVLIFLVGDAIIRGCVWVVRHLSNQGHVLDYSSAWPTFVVFVGLVVSLTGGACMIRHFAPARFGPWPWMLAVIASLALGIYFAA